MSAKKFVLLLLSGLLVALCSCSASETIPPEAIPAPAAVNDFYFSVLKVGQADAIIMRTENHCVIIDCGEKDDGDEVVEYLTGHGIQRVDYLFITHFDKDHVGGVPEVMENMEIGQIITSDYEGTGAKYNAYIKALEENKITPQPLTESNSFQLDDVLFEIFPPQMKSYKKDNDFSLAVSVTHGENNFLFTGDALEVRVSEIMAQTDREYDFLKFPHHGRYNSATKEFVECIKPAYTVITDSDKNPAEDQTIDALKTVGSEIYCTKDGNISVRSNGIEISVTQ